MRALASAALAAVLATACVAGPRAAAPPGCSETPRTEIAPSDPHVATLSKLWYRSADGMLSASGGSAAYTRFFQGRGGNRVIWERPAGTMLAITGHSLGRAGPTVRATIPDGHQEDLQVTSLHFSEPGCWQVEARAGASTLAFVVHVYPAKYAPARATCEDLADAVRGASVVVEATAGAERADIGGFTATTFQVHRVVLGAEPADQLVLYRDSMSDGPALPDGSRYVLFLARNDGGALRIICPQRTAFEIDGSHVNPPLDAVWSGGSFAELVSRVKALGRYPPTR